jgi:hypothetical protein
MAEACLPQLIKRSDEPNGSLDDGAVSKISEENGTNTIFCARRS